MTFRPKPPTAQIRLYREDSSVFSGAGYGLPTKRPVPPFRIKQERDPARCRSIF